MGQNRGPKSYSGTGNVLTYPISRFDGFSPAVGWQEQLVGSNGSPRS
jgi:hypothetical protein